MLWSHFGSSHRIYSNRFFVCQLIWLENWPLGLLQGHYGGSFYDMGLVFQFVEKIFQNQKRKRKIKRFHVLLKFIYHRKLYTPIDRVFTSWLLWFSFSKILLSKDVLLLRLWHFASSHWSYSLDRNDDKGWSFPILWCMRIYKNILKAGRILFRRFTLDSWLIFLDCNVFYLE